MIESEIIKDRPLALNDDFTINPTTYEITDEDLVLKYTSSKEVTRALAMIKEWKYAKSFTSNTITFANADFDIGTNNMSVVDVNYSDNTYGRFSSGITVIKKEVITPPPVIDNPPTIENINNLSGSTGEIINITYIANDDNGITKHEFYNGSSWATKTPNKNGDNYTFTHTFRSSGVKECKVRVTDNNNKTSISNIFTIEVNEPVINNPPTVTINEATSNYNGEYSVKYTLSDTENDSIQIKLKIDSGEYFVISEASENGIHTYRGIGLKEGSHSLTLKVYDGFNYVEKSVSVIVPPKPIDPVNDYPILYDKTGTVKIGELKDIIDECYCEEERNGVFGIEFEYPNGYPFSDKLIEENIVEIKPNDEQGPQKFRIYETKKLMGNTISIFAWHESFDLANDNVENINLENASCEYALNTLFRSSHFSKDFRGYSDIINAQNYKIDNVNILNAIAGKEGSIIDTYGTGAEILRDGKNIHVLNKRGHDNGVTIEYGKNLTGFELSVDLAGLETRCGGFAKYKNESTNEEVIVKSDWIDSPFILNFAHPYINVEGRRDYSDKFKDGVIPTKEALNKLCSDEFKINKIDIPSNNYRIEFIPLSKCVGYEGIEDKISLCDTVTIIDPRFNINTKVKVIKYKYDFINQRYISMELGEPRTTLGDIIGGGNGTQGPPGKDGTNGKDGEPGKDGSIEDFPHTLPITPVLTAKVKGFASIDLSWTFEDKVYYTYELYASKTKDFKPNTFDLIHSGQSSSFLFQAKPAETWYFRVCAKNTHGDRTEFSSQVTVVTQKVDNFDEYFSSLGVGNLVANIFSADYMEAGIIKANWVELKGASVIDGNGKRTFDIDSFGRITLMPSVFKMMIDGKEEDVATKSQLTQVENKLQFKIEQSGNQNYGSNTDFSKGLAGWETYNSNYISSVAGGWNVPVGSGAYIVGQGDKAVYLKQTVKVPPKAEKYYASAYLNCTNFLNIGGRPEESLWHFYVVLRYTDGTGETKKVPCWDENHAQGSWKRKYVEFIRDINKTVESIETYLYVRYVEGNFYISMVKTETDQLGAWVQGIHEINTEIVELDDRGIWCKHQNGSAMNAHSQSVDFTNENGRKKMSVKNGGLNYYNFQSGLFVGLDSSTQFSDEFSKFGMQKFVSKHCSFYDILHSPTTETDDNLKLANSVFRICFENVEGPTDWRSVKGIHSFMLHRFHEGIDMVEKPIKSCGTIYLGTSTDKTKVTYDDMYEETQIGGGSGGVIIGRTNPDGSIEHAIKVYQNYYIDTTRDWNFQGHKIENANIISNFAPTPMLRSFAYRGNDSYTNLIDTVDVVNIDSDKLALTKKEYDGGSNQFSETQLLYAAVEKIKELENTISVLNEEINNMKGVV